MIIVEKMKKLNTIVALCLLVCCLCTTFVGCKKEEPGAGSGSGDGGKTEVSIASLTATESSVEMKVGEDILITNFYEIKGTSSLSAAQRACTYTSSNPDVVEIDGKKAVAVSNGTATITVTSNLDNTKSCSFEVVVTKVFFDRELNTINPDDDFSKEWDSVNDKPGSIQTTSKANNYYYIADVESTTWYVETDITFNAVGFKEGTEEIDEFPKIGIIASAKDSNGTETMVAFYLNTSAYQFDENGNNIGSLTNWNEFGVCEVNNDKWAWEDNITDAMARHHDFAWNTGDVRFGYGDTFKLGVARNGADFHVYVNGNYMGSYKLDTSMGILAENGQVLASNVGFFEFSSDVTFSNYSATTDVTNKIPATPVYVETFNADDND